MTDPPKVNATTNEHDYKAGFDVAVAQYSCKGDCQNPTDIDAVAACGIGKPLGWYTITNSTACEDGYLNGWKHWCKTNAQACVGICNTTLFLEHSLLENH
jgi:hypothetical protein